MLFPFSLASRPGRSHLSVEPLEDRTLPAAGFLDPTFGVNGKVSTDFAGGTEFIGGMALQADGKIVVAGSTGDNFAVARYNPDGSLDGTFSLDGKVVTDFGANDRAEGVAVQADGRIVVAGTAVTFPDDSGEFPSAQAALARYNPDGTLDVTFGTNGLVLTDFGGDFDAANGVTLQADGKIVVAGTSVRAEFVDRRLVVARYNSDGSPDADFDADGLAATTSGTSSAEALSVAVGPDGKVVAAGSVESGGNVSFFLVRYHPDGTPDAGFGANGQVVTDFGPGFDRAESILLQPDGKLVAAGLATVGTGLDFALARYHADGRPDSDFDADGRLTTDFGGGDDGAFDVALQADGKIVAAGQTGGGGGGANFALARYHPDGSLDPGFSFDGKVATDFGRDSDGAAAVALGPDGRILVAGNAIVRGSFDFALARYEGGPAGGAASTAGAPAVVYAGVHHPSDQRSRVARLRVTFSTTVTFDPGAFRVVRRDGLRVGVRVTSSLVNGRTVAVLTFVGTAVVGGSLPDGNYTLTIRGSRVHNSDGTSGLDHVYSFFRLYGDADGDRDVDAVDRAAFLGTLNRSRGDPGFLAYFDGNGDGVIDLGDKTQFDRRMGRYLLP